MIDIIISLLYAYPYYYKTHGEVTATRGPAATGGARVCSCTSRRAKTFNAQPTSKVVTLSRHDAVLGERS